jgi:hypothetical protein
MNVVHNGTVFSGPPRPSFMSLGSPLNQRLRQLLSISLDSLCSAPVSRQRDLRVSAVDCRRLPTVSYKTKPGELITLWPPGQHRQQQYDDGIPPSSCRRHAAVWNDIERNSTVCPSPVPRNPIHRRGHNCVPGHFDSRVRLGLVTQANLSYTTMVQATSGPED